MQLSAPLARWATKWGAIGLIASAALLGCGGDPTADLIGNWVQTEGENPGTRLILRSDGTGKLEVPGAVNHQIDHWTIQGDQHINFTVFSQEVKGRFIATGTTVEISRIDRLEAFNGLYRQGGD